jgi:hypothetical protein
VTDLEDRLRDALDRSLTPPVELLATVQRAARRRRDRRRAVLAATSLVVLAGGAGGALSALGSDRPDRVTVSQDPPSGLEPCAPTDLGFDLVWQQGQYGHLSGVLDATKITAGTCDYNLKPSFIPIGEDGTLLDTTHVVTKEGRVGTFELHHGESVRALLTWVNWCGGVRASASVLIGTSRADGRVVEATGQTTPLCPPGIHHNQTSSGWYDRVELSASDSAAVACAQRFPDVRLAARNTAAGAHEGGPRSTSAPTSPSYRGFAGETPVSECLVPDGADFSVWVLYPDGESEHRWTQHVGDQFLRPV